MDDATNIILTIAVSVIAIIGTYLANARFQRRFSLIERVWVEKYQALQGLTARLSKIKTSLAQYKCVVNIKNVAGMHETEIKEISALLEDKMPGEGENFARKISQVSRICYYTGQVDALRQSLKIEPNFMIKTSSDAMEMTSDELDDYTTLLEQYMSQCISDSIDIDFYELLSYLDNISLIVEDTSIIDSARLVSDLVNSIRAKEKDFQSEMDLIVALSKEIKEKSIKELYNTKTAKRIKQNRSSKPWD